VGVMNCPVSPHSIKLGIFKTGAAYKEDIRSKKSTDDAL
jgi:hypothetical protein